MNREIYLEWYRSERRERYQKERDRKYGVCSLDGLREKGYFFGMAINEGNVAEEIALRNLGRNNLWDALKKLSEQEIQLIKLLYFEEITIRKVAGIFECSRKSVENRRRKILQKLLVMIDESKH